ncbi:MAG: response regulator transcription factor [Nitrospirae bacterium]|nr:response regulator transcription factor [Nitrospirota bacterium]
MTGQIVLLIEDDRDITRLIERELVSRHYRVEMAHTGRDGLQIARRQHVDLIVLDLLLPDLSGFDVCRLLRQEQGTFAVPILILTALAGEEDRVRGLEYGADDYLSKPFSMRELVTRIRSLLRRSGMEPRSQNVTVGGLSIDRQRHEVIVRGHAVELTPTEFAILEFLAKYHGQVFTREQLLTHLWGEDYFILDHNLDVHMYALRGKVERDPKHPALLLTIRGVGFKLNDGGER